MTTYKVGNIEYIKDDHNEFQAIDPKEENKWNNSIQDLRDKWDAVNDLLSDNGRLKWYPELLDGIIDCIETERERKTIEFLLEKKLKEINEEVL